MTIVPALPVMSTAALITSLFISPTVQITLSASWPRVRSMSTSLALTGSPNACVAPKSSACSCFQGFGSMAKTYFAPAYLAPWTAFMPTPPVPKTTATSPTRTSPA